MPEWTVPGYTELKRIGSGGFGEVVLARHDSTGTLTAVKYLRAELLEDQEFLELFRGEAAVLAAMDDPNVVRLYEYVESPSGAAIVMELVAGVSLREILTYQGKTTAQAALVVLQGSLLGLAAAHRRGVVHRDYKPENVLVTGDGVSKLTDFGIAARAGDRPVPAGTLAYAAPEQMAGGAASPASDIYAATATFYECLTGRPPFTGGTGEMLLRQHRAEPVPLDPLPEPLRPLVAAGMAKDAAARPTDATAFVAELGTAAAGAYGGNWQEQGRSHLGEAALLLALLWPSGPPPTVQGTTSAQVQLGGQPSRPARLRRPRLRPHLRHLGTVKGAVAAGVAIAAVAAGTALAVTSRGPAFRPTAAGRPLSSQAVSLQPTTSQLASVSPDSASTSPAAPTPASAAPQPTSRSAAPRPTSASAVPPTSKSAAPPTPRSAAPPPTSAPPAPPPTTTPPTPVAPAVPQITSVGTHTQGVLVYFDIQYADPGNDAEGFGFVGVNGSGWAEENHPFSSPSYGIVGPDSISYPFNQGCGTAQQVSTYVEAWIYDTAGDRSDPVVIHLIC